jgi:hypothetical protein
MRATRAKGKTALCRVYASIVARSDQLVDHMRIESMESLQIQWDMPSRPPE